MIIADKKFIDVSYEPVASIESGSIITVRTNSNVYEKSINEKNKIILTNIVAGPILLEHESQINTIKIEVIDIRLDNYCYCVHFSRHTKPSTFIKKYPIKSNRIVLHPSLSIPISPTIGFIGISPLKTTTFSTLDVHPSCGGNMDIDVQMGDYVLLPVHDKPSFYIGDVHASCGLSEPTGSALEVGAEIDIKVSVAENKVKSPRVYKSESVLCVEISMTSLEDAYNRAVNSTYNILTNEYNLDYETAHAFISGSVDLIPGGPAKPMIVARIPYPG